MQDNVRTERNRLIAAARIAVKRDPNLRSILREISEGNSNMDSIQDILSLSKLLLNVLDTVSGIAVGGVKIDEEHLNRKREWAGEIKQILNKADALRNVRQEEIIYRNKIILLCRQAQATINTWLDAVFFFFGHAMRENRRCGPFLTLFSCLSFLTTKHTKYSKGE
ncbi:hypothetical protein CHISP_1212 [Chitinispirillum alkaliphilum]|nr:hypothetical protein CHISP_1212 [Chitinispirillum alkaliphilum]